MQEPDAELLLRAVRRLARRSARLALRCLADKVRERRLGAGSGAESAGAEHELCLAEYGGGGAAGDRDYTKEEIADEVVAAKAHRSCLFAYGEAADAVASRGA